MLPDFDINLLLVNELNALNRIELAEKYGEDIHKIEKKQSKKKLEEITSRKMLLNIKPSV